MNSLTSSLNELYMNAVCAPTFETRAFPFFSSVHFSKNTSVACAKIVFTKNLTTSRLKSVDGACKKFSLIYVSMPAHARN